MNINNLSIFFIIPSLLIDVAKLVLIPILLTLLTLLTSNIVYAQGVILTPEDNLAKQKILANLSNAVDHGYDQYDLLIGSVKGDNSTFTIYNKSGTVPPLVCGPGTHEQDGVCVPDISGPTCPHGQFFNTTSQQCEDLPPNPVEICGDAVDNDNDGQIDEGCTVTSSGNTTKIFFSGDFDGTGTIKAMKNRSADYNIALGDLGYQEDLADFKANWEKLNNDHCVIGNHDSVEKEEGKPIVKQAKDFCGDIWLKKVAGGTTLLLGFNTNGKLGDLGDTAKGWVTNSTIMDGVKNVVIVTHKPCETFPNSDHSVQEDVKQNFCDKVKPNILPAGVKLIKIAGHNHELASKSDASAYIAGGGGREHRECGIGSGWNFCKNNTDGYLEFVINNDTGEIKAKFYNNNGGVIS